MLSMVRIINETWHQFKIVLCNYVQLIGPINISKNKNYCI